MNFTLQHTDTGSKARAGLIETDHGSIQTPIFMPVGTAGTVKAVHQRELKQDINADIILGNTYHLYLRPGTDILQQAGGLHKFIGWDRPILTDSGGYQVYSLAASRKITEEGVKFQSHVDGSRHLFTPESVMDVQRLIGADIMMAFDECTPYPCDYDYASKSLDMTHRWLDRCINRFDSTEGHYGYSQTLFPIVQGSVYPDLRKKSAEYIASKNREGNAIGGLSVGEPDEDMYAMTELVCDILPSRNARHGMLYTSEGIINIRNKKWENDFTPVDPAGNIFADTEYTRAYLRHLLVTNERLAGQIATLHNLGFYLWLVRTAREKIIEGTFANWKADMLKRVTQRL